MTNPPRLNAARRTRVALALFAFALGLATPFALGSAGTPEQRQPSWRITSLGVLGSQGSEALSISERGQVIGVRDHGRSLRSFLWYRGQVVDLGTLGGDSTRVAAISERGQIVGWSTLANGDRHAFLWENGEMTDLGTLGGDSSYAHAINERGEVVGESTTASGERRAFLWRRGKMTNLGTLGGRSSVALDINNRGQIVGASRRPPKGGPFAFVRERGTLRPLSARRSAATAINERGEIIGWAAFTAPEDTRAVLWRDGRMIDLARRSDRVTEAWAINAPGQVVAGTPLGGRPYQFVWDHGTRLDLRGISVEQFPRPHDVLNDRGQLVGYARDHVGGGRPIAAVWFEGRVTKLSTLRAGTEGSAQAINERGLIVGWSTGDGGVRRAVLWTPTKR